MDFSENLVEDLHYSINFSAAAPTFERVKLIYSCVNVGSQQGAVMTRTYCTHSHLTILPKNISKKEQPKDEPDQQSPSTLPHRVNKEH